MACTYARARELYITTGLLFTPTPYNPTQQSYRYLLYVIHRRHVAFCCAPVFAADHKKTFRICCVSEQQDNRETEELTRESDDRTMNSKYYVQCAAIVRASVCTQTHSYLFIKSKPILLWSQANDVNIARLLY